MTTKILKLTAREKIIWTASMIEGEGSIGIFRQQHPRRTYFQLRVIVVNTDIKLLQRLSLLWGGKVTLGYKETKKLRTRWLWALYDKQAGTFLTIILPAIIGSKKAQIELAVSFTTTLVGRGNKISDTTLRKRQRMRDKMILLNKKGPRR